MLDDRGLIKTLNIKIIHQGKINGKKQTKAQKEQMKMNMANFKDSQISHPACVDMVVQASQQNQDRTVCVFHLHPQLLLFIIVAGKADSDPLPATGSACCPAAADRLPIGVI